MWLRKIVLIGNLYHVPSSSSYHDCSLPSRVTLRHQKTQTSCLLQTWLCKLSVSSSFISAEDRKEAPYVSSFAASPKGELLRNITNSLIPTGAIYFVAEFRRMGFPRNPALFPWRSATPTASSTAAVMHRQQQTLQKQEHNAPMAGRVCWQREREQRRASLRIRIQRCAN